MMVTKKKKNENALKLLNFVLKNKRNIFNHRIIKLGLHERTTSNYVIKMGKACSSML